MEAIQNRSFIGLIVKAMAVCYLIHLAGCTIKIDNPFYAPSTLDVNKNTSTGAANYLKVEKPMTPGKPD